MEPSSARVNAGCRAPTSTSKERTGNLTCCRPVGTSPMAGVLLNHRTPSSVPATSATRVGGRNLRNRLGHLTPTTRVTAAIANAPKLALPIASGQARIAPIGPPIATGAPRKGRVWQEDNDDADTGHEPGDHRVPRVRNKTTDPHHAQKNLYQTRHDDDRERLGEAVRLAGADDRHRHGHRTGGAGDLRPHPPNTAAKNPTAIAPYMPAKAPKPDTTRKANATGNPTTAEVIPPKTSPRKAWRS